MSISSINTSAQTGLVPNSLLGYSTNGDSALEILPTSITIGGNLLTTPIFVGISATTGLTTTNPNGLDVNCDFNMNSNDITNIDTLSSTIGSNLTLDATTEKIIAKNDIIMEDATEPTWITTLETGGLSFNIGGNYNITLDAEGGATIISSDNTGASTLFSSLAPSVLSLDDGTIVNNISPTGITTNGAFGIANVGTFTLDTTSGNIDIIAQTDDINLQSTTGMSLSVGNGALTLDSLQTDINGAIVNISATSTSVNIAGSTIQLGSSAGDINLTSNSANVVLDANVATNITAGTELNITTGAEINIINPTETFFNLTSPNTGDGVVYGNFNGTFGGNATSASTIAIVDNNTSATYYPTFVSNNTGNLALNVDKTTNPLSYIPSTGNLSSTLFTGLLSTGGLVYLSTGSQSITGSASATNISLTSIFNSTYKNYRIVLAPTTQLTFSAYPSYSLAGFLGSGTLPTTASLYGFEITSSASSVVSPVYTAGATISSAPLILAVSQVINHQTIIEVENVGFSATAGQSIGLKCKSFYSNPGVSGASDRSILATNPTGTITGLTLQQSSISVSNNMTIGWTIYAYK